MDVPPPTPARNPLAALSLLLGVLAPLTCGATALPALVFGYVALRRANLSDGRLPGARAARWGMVLGALGAALFLGGLGVVGLSRLRENSHETNCLNNLRGIGVAITVYHDEQAPKHFPPGTIPNPALPPEKRLSWMAAVLPYVEMRPDFPEGGTERRFARMGHKGADLFGRLDTSKAWDAAENRAAVDARLTWFVCPSVPAEPGAASYVGLAGVGADAATLPRADPRAGFFGYDRLIDLDYVRAHRGLAETMTVTERASPAGRWAEGGPATVAGLDPARRPVVPEQFGGLHPHAANVLFADGHATPVSDRAATRVWEDQTRINVEE